MVDDEALPGVEIVELHGSTAGHVYSPSASMPSRGFEIPFPDTPGFRKVHGRQGDLLVVQLSSSIGSPVKKRDALRTLGLSGPHSASLQSSRNPALWGNIRQTREMVAVLVLPDNMNMERTINHPDQMDGEVLNIKYGTNSKPAELWRREDGRYFAYEIGRRAACTSFWSTDLDLVGLVDEIGHAGFPPVPDRMGYVALRSNPLTGTSVSHHPGSWRELYPNEGEVVKALIPIGDSSSVTWQAPFARFWDQDHKLASAGVISSPIDIAMIRALFSATGPSALSRSGLCNIRVHAKGKSREYTL